MTDEELKVIVCDMFLGSDHSFPITSDTQLVDEGIIDSLGLVQLATHIENQVPEISISDQEITRENFGSVRAMNVFLQSKTK